MNTKHDSHDSHDSYGRHVASRRRALRALAAGACLLIVKPARATFEEMAAALHESFGERPISTGKVTLTMPRLAENGSVVPVTVSVDSPMTPQDHVTAIHLFAPQNHLPKMVEFQLGPHNGRAQVSSRVRLARSQQISAVAVMSDGTLWAAVADVEVVTSECGL